MRLTQSRNNQRRRPLKVKFSRDEIKRRAHRIPELKFEDQHLTSFAGLVVYQKLFSGLRLKERLRKCFSHMTVKPIYGHHIVMLLLVIHLLIGYRRLRDIEYYKDDPMVKRLLGLSRLPEVSTISRSLRTTDSRSIDKVRALLRVMCIERVQQERIRRLTLDFDGSVLGTNGRNIEGTAVGFNKRKKGKRSYYPLYCTVAQTGQVLDVHHRPGNVHDSNGAKQFILDCISYCRMHVPWAKIEVRMDSAFFSDEIVRMLDQLGIEFSISVPFERFAPLNQIIEHRQRWRRLDDRWSYFENGWKPKTWKKKYRFIFVRQKCKKIRKEPVQLDLFVPHQYGYEFKVIVTNKKIKAKKVLMYHNGRGTQENLLGEMKSQTQMDYIAVRRLYGNQLYMFSAIFAHNLNRELQMATRPRQRSTTEKRTTLWKFDEAGTVRNTLLNRAGRLTRPQGKLTLTMSANKRVQKELMDYLEALDEAA